MPRLHRNGYVVRLGREQWGWNAYPRNTNHVRSETCLEAWADQPSWRRESGRAPPPPSTERRGEEERQKRHRLSHPLKIHRNGDRQNNDWSPNWKDAGLLSLFFFLQDETIYCQPFTRWACSIRSRIYRVNGPGPCIVHTRQKIEWEARSLDKAISIWPCNSRTSTELLNPATIFHYDWASTHATQKHKLLNSRLS